MSKNWTGLLGILSLWGLAAAITWHGYITKDSGQLGTAKIEQIVHDYLLKNPRIMLEMENRLRAQEQAEELKAIQRVQEAVRKEFKTMLTSTGELMGLHGPTNKDYILWYFTQPRCPSCHKADHLVQEVVNNHPELEQRIFYWPFFGGEAVNIAKLAMAAASQQLAKELYNLVINYTGQDAIKLSEVQQLASTLPNIDMVKLTKDAKDVQLAKRLKNNFLLASKLQLDGTPTIIITDSTGHQIEVLSGFDNNLKRNLEERLMNLKKLKQTQTP